MLLEIRNDRKCGSSKDGNLLLLLSVLGFDKKDNGKDGTTEINTVFFPNNTELLWSASRHHSVLDFIVPLMFCMCPPDLLSLLLETPN